jgi:hypothetical protein
MRTFLFVLLLLAGGCQNLTKWPKLVPASQIYSYPLRDQQYVILVVEDNGVDEEDAKRTAIQKASQVSLANGYRYFSILSEKKVEVVKRSADPASQMPGNLYHEKIIEKDFGRDNLERGASFSTGTYPAYRLEIECYSEKPSMKKAYDAKQFAAVWIF